MHYCDYVIKLGVRIFLSFNRTRIIFSFLHVGQVIPLFVFVSDFVLQMRSRKFTK